MRGGLLRLRRLCPQPCRPCRRRSRPPAALLPRVDCCCPPPRPAAVLPVAALQLHVKTLLHVKQPLQQTRLHEKRMRKVHAKKNRPYGFTPDPLASLLEPRDARGSDACRADTKLGNIQLSVVPASDQINEQSTRSASHHQSSLNETAALSFGSTNQVQLHKIKNVVAPTAHAIKRSSLVLRAKLPSLVAVRSRTRIGHYKQLDSTCEAWTIRRRCFERQYLGP